MAHKIHRYAAPFGKACQPRARGATELTEPGAGIDINHSTSSGSSSNDEEIGFFFFACSEYRAGWFGGQLHRASASPNALCAAIRTVPVFLPLTLNRFQAVAGEDARGCSKKCGLSDARNSRQPKNKWQTRVQSRRPTPRSSSAMRLARGGGGPCREGWSATHRWRRRRAVLSDFWGGSPRPRPCLCWIVFHSPRRHKIQRPDHLCR